MQLVVESLKDDFIVFEPYELPNKIISNKITSLLESMYSDFENNESTPTDTKPDIEGSKQVHVISGIDISSAASERKVHIDAEYCFESATELIQRYTDNGWSVNAKQEGKRWIIDAVYSA